MGSLSGKYRTVTFGLLPNTNRGYSSSRRSVAQALFEVAPLLAFGAEPGDGPIREHAVQDHQALDRPVDRDSPAVPVVRLADGRVERLVVNVEDPRPSGRSELDRGHEPPDQQLLDEVVNLLPVCDAGERGVLPADEHAGVQHDGRQEASLTLCETERHEDPDALGCRLVRPRDIRRCVHSRDSPPWTGRSLY